MISIEIKASIMFLQPQLKHHSKLTKELICISYVPFIHSFIGFMYVSVSSRDLLGGAILTLKLVWLYIEKLLQIEPKFIMKDLFII